MDIAKIAFSRRGIGRLRENAQINRAQNMKLTINELEIQAPNFAMALNKQVVPRSKYATTQIQENDQVEIVHAVGGGI